MPIVTHNIRLAAPTVTQQGFGVPLILGHHDEWGDRVRTYNSASALATLVSEGFATTDPIYLAVQAIVSQAIRPKTVKVGRRDNNVTQIIDLTPTVTTEGYVYVLTIGDEEFTYTVQSLDAVADIIDGLVADMAAHTGAWTETDNTTKLTITADNAGAFFEVSVGGVQGDVALTVKDVSAAASIATDIANVRLSDDDWYALVLSEISGAEVTAAAAAVQSLEKIMLASLQDTDLKLSGSSDVASGALALSYHRSAIMYHSNPLSFPHAAWLGRVLPLDPGAENWAYKVLTGISADALTADQISKLESKRCNYYTTEYGAKMTKLGYVADATYGWLDVVRGVDWAVARMRERIAIVLTTQDKVPYNQAGIDGFASIIEGVLREGERKNVFAPGSSVVTPPDISDISASDKAARTLPDMVYQTTLAGAINEVTITGTISI